MSAAISDDAGIDELLARMRVNADKFNAAFTTLMELVDAHDNPDKENTQVSPEAYNAVISNKEDKDE